MTEQQISDQLHAAVGDEPPLGFNPDEVVDRAANRQRRRRQLGGTIGVVCAVAALSVTAVTVLGPDDRGSAPVGTEQDTSVCRWPVSGPGEISFPGGQNVIKQVSDTALRVFDDHIPDATVEQLVHNGYECPPGLGFQYDVNGANEVFLDVSRRADSGPDLDLPFGPDEPVVAAELVRHDTLADGSLLWVWDQGRSIAVKHLRTDGTGVALSGPTTAIDLTVDDYTAVVTDPRLTFDLGDLQPPDPAKYGPDATCQEPSKNGELGFPNLDGLMDNLDVAITQALREDLPNVRLAPDEIQREVRGWHASHCPATVTHTLRITGTEDPALGAVQATLSRRGQDGPDLDNEANWSEAEDMIDEQTLDDGSVLRIYEWAVSAGDAAPVDRWLWVRHYRTDGTIVEINAPEAFGVTLDDLITLTTDPRLTFEVDS